MAYSDREGAGRCHRDWDNDSIIDELEDNINDCVTITTSGGCCFTGLLTSVSDDALKLVCRNRITVIRLDDVQTVTFCSRTWC